MPRILAAINVTILADALTGILLLGALWVAGALR